MKRYLLNLEGQGDTIIALIDQELWDWIVRPDTPGRKGDETGWVDPAAPPRVLKMMAKYRDKPFVTSGSLDNDRALHVANSDIEGVVTFNSVREYTRYIQKHPEIEIVEEYEGYIY